MISRFSRNLTLRGVRSFSISKRLSPLGNRVLVQKASVRKQTSGGIMIPDSALKNELNEGTVVAVGPGKVLKDGSTAACTVSVDDRVLLPDYGGTSLSEGDSEFVLLKDEDLLAILDH